MAVMNLRNLVLRGVAVGTDGLAIQARLGAGLKLFDGYSRNDFFQPLLEGVYLPDAEQVLDDDKTILVVASLQFILSNLREGH